MSTNYISSIINKYGDSENVPKDCKLIFDIIQRQGTNILLDCIAEHVGGTVNKFKLNESDRTRAVNCLLDYFKEALNERI